MKKEYSIFEIKKYLNKKGFVIKKKKKLKTQESGLDNISRTFLSSLIIISIFFITPLAINLTKEKMIFSKDYENNSKTSLKKLLKNQTTKLDEELDKKVLERLSSPLSCVLIFFLTINPFLFKYFFISKSEYFFCIPILQPLLLPQVNNDTKDFARLVLKSLLSWGSQNNFLVILL